MFLEPTTFRTVVASTPLVSIDLLVRNQQGEVLLGQRLNRPARGFWFVPGGRIYKQETLDSAFRRITETELGQAYTRDQASLLGVYEHFYEDSVFGDYPSHPDTHYVTIGYEFSLPAGCALAPDNQHGSFRWWSIEEMVQSAEVHQNTKAYLL
ncbi:MAG TPA: GDP-mannose mannosyl hydrolase [Pseudomonas xinjiangensis]|uniref:GDP-mannose mannosyl hydrolase n=2 Tax=root TaxID=1 RepID=A0A7V1BSQ0_9GAMM|nr:GDP-mannose mannosyl hydrolase [Halopseudomonas xinjiangensis]HEC47897.1 GDP-mannose mannosyl hydrolase [Halopseudomonas xinjiangensis]